MLFNTRSSLLQSLSSVQRKSNMAFKFIPIERQQSLQIDFLEENQRIRVCLVAFSFQPALTGIKSDLR